MLSARWVDWHTVASSAANGNAMIAVHNVTFLLRHSVSLPAMGTAGSGSREPSVFLGASSCFRRRGELSSTGLPTHR